MKIHIESIAHSSQRYSTVGDWYYENDILHIKVSNLPDERMIALVAVHELIEFLLCKHRNITQEQIDRFDMKFEAEREAFIKAGCTKEQYAAIVGAEPGDDSFAPYHKEHCFATGIERLLASELDMPWLRYEKEIEKL